MGKAKRVAGEGAVNIIYLYSLKKMYFLEIENVF